MREGIKKWKQILPYIILILFSFINSKNIFSAYPNHVVIAKVYIDGSDYEHVVLYNPTPNDIDISGWYIQAGGSTEATFPTTTILTAYHYISIGDSGANPDVVDAMVLNDTSADDVSLYDSGGILIDRVGYNGSATAEGTSISSADSPQDAYEYLERKAIGTSTAADLGIGGAHEFLGNSEDSDDNASDFILMYSVSSISTQAWRAWQFEHIHIKKNGDVSAYSFWANQSNKVVMALILRDPRTGDTLKKVKIGNLGTMLNGIDVSNVKIWNDNGANVGDWDSGDTFIGFLRWDGSSYYTNNNLSGFNINDAKAIITIDLTSNPTIGRTFQAYIPKKGFTCISNGSHAYALTNANTQTVIAEPELIVTKNYNIPAYKFYWQDIRQVVMSINIVDSGGDNLSSFVIENIGTMQNGTDVANVILWEDNGTIPYEWDNNDTYITNLQWTGTYWSNSIITNGLSLGGSGRNFIITIDIQDNAIIGRTFQAQIPSNGIKSSDGDVAPADPLSNPNSQIVGKPIVINEIMWMGTDVSPADEWIELRNMTSHAFNFYSEPWTLYQVGVATPELIINGGILEPNGYFLIANYDASSSKIDVNPDIVDPDVSLSDTSLQLKLYRGTGSSTNLVDVAWDGSDPGTAASGTSSDPYYSFVRKDDPGDGSLTTSWYNATNSIGWDPPATNVKGTPGFDNTPDNTPPAAITNLTAATTNTNGGVVLHWTAPGDDG